METGGRLCLPSIRKITFSDFSLFPMKPEIAIDVPDGVLCLAGANGIGKSTLLSALNFALTGVVPEPDKGIRSIEGYPRQIAGFSQEYFTGRISEEDRGTAQIAVEMQLGSRLYRITRGVFEPDELRELTVLEVGDGEVLVDAQEVSPAERHQLYAKTITSDMGLASFSQFIFIQLFMLTFDERRHLLFWDDLALEQALYLAFGVDHGDAKKVDELQKKAGQADSRARNFKWHATRERQAILALRQALDADSNAIDGNLAEEHERLYNELQLAEAKAARAEQSRDDSLLGLADATSEEHALRAAYDQAVADRLRASRQSVPHPCVLDGLSRGTCAVCGATGKSVADAVRGSMNGDSCPLCGTRRQDKGEPSLDLSDLKSIDKRISATAKRRTELGARVERQREELARLQNTKAEKREVLGEFERTNGLAPAEILGDAGSAERLETAISGREERVRELLEKVKEERGKRNRFRRELAPLNTKLEALYAKSEERFVVLFKQLAYRFLGLDLDIRLELPSTGRMKLVVEVESETRRRRHELSESQRFFLDIALRMSLAQYVSGEGSRSCLYIDTPEGALDIAYEARAGDMFARYVSQGNNLIMTANINTSQLLQNLAAHCGASLMRLCRMTSWAELSDVQRDEEGRFNTAFSAIEAALASGSPTGE